MPLKVSGAGENPRIIDDGSYGLTWLAHPEESLQRASHALAVDGEVWLVDPVEAAGVDDAVEALGRVAGVVVLLERHTRDAAAFARRYDVAVHLPDFVEDASDDLDAPVERFADELAETGYRARPVVDLPSWREAALVDGAGDTVVVADTLCTAPLYTSPSERVVVHPFLRPWPPRRAFADLDPDRLVVGHGPPVLGGAGSAIREALAGARRRAPQAYWHSLKRLVRG